MKKYKIEDLKHRIKRSQENIESLNNEIKFIDDLIEISIPELFGVLSKITEEKDFETENFKLSIVNTKYEHILGGDGRSRPWSEQRGGVAVVINSKYYLIEEHIEAIKDYLKRVQWSFDVIQLKKSK